MLAMSATVRGSVKLHHRNGPGISTILEALFARGDHATPASNEMG